MKVNRKVICAAAAALSIVLSASPALGACRNNSYRVLWRPYKVCSYLDFNSYIKNFYSIKDLCGVKDYNEPKEETNKDNCNSCQNNVNQENSVNNENKNPDTVINNSQSVQNSGTSASNPDQKEEVSQNSEFAAEKQAILSLVNQYRAQNGLSPLKMNEKASAAADVRAKEISTNFSHTRPNGASFSTALDSVGIKNGSRGENIANGYKTSQSVMTAWMNSSGHRANILNASYKELGVGVYKDASGKLNWVQLFVG